MDKDTAITFDANGNPIETISHSEDGDEFRLNKANEGKKTGKNLTKGHVSLKAKNYADTWQKETGFSIQYDSGRAGIGMGETNIDLISTFRSTTLAWKNDESKNPILETH